MTNVVTCFLRHRTAVLLGRRSDAVGTYTGRWAGISGYVEGDPADAERDARREVREETGRTDATLVRAGDPVDIEDDGREWTVHPFLFEVDSREVTPNEEIAVHEWVSPPAIRERETVPGLWAVYAAVAPTVETVASDDTHGAAWISVRALEVLRDRAAVADDEAAVASVARALRDARPSMAAVANRVNRVMSGGDRTPGTVRDRAAAAAEAALDADDAAAATAAERCGVSVVTLSQSGTVRAALDRARPAVLIGESRPAREGTDVAASLADAELDVTLTTEAALPAELAARAPDSVLVGADAVLADGSVVNKVGTRGLALAAAREDVPVYVVAAAAKVRPDEAVHGETGDTAALYDGAAPVSVANPIFDRTPADLVTGVVTERGVLDTEGIRAVAAEHRERAEWDGGLEGAGTVSG
ncbi:NUDIX domain-containing protein [Haloplanus litoreus]|uniref:NUDIX domain-containing protein n=1 Tax=Haloplanus litoreus TaxID=767515 RepID=A0ABD5ZV61_9EURY